MADMMECVEEIAAALRHLSDEVGGRWHEHKADLRQMMGPENYNFVATRIDEARAALARYEASK